MRNLICLSDVLLIAGLCSLGYGLYLYSPWLAFTVCGALVLTGGMLLAMGEVKG